MMWQQMIDSVLNKNSNVMSKFISKNESFDIKEILARNKIVIFNVLIAIVVMVLLIVNFGSSLVMIVESNLPIKVDYKKEYTLDSGQPLTGNTQSLNRYHSVLNSLDNVIVDFSPKSKLFNFTLTDGKKENAKKVFYKEIDSRFLTPLLPYNISQEITEFDAYNLMLAEYARVGLTLSYQENNKHFGSFWATEGVFNKGGEYLFQDNEILPNSGILPTRMSITNNCLSPGLWEINAKDSVGEMFHGWVDLPRDIYFDAIRANNNIVTTDWDLLKILKYKTGIAVLLDLDTLRKSKGIIQDSKLQLADGKKIGSYSSQDSRRKTQKNFFTITRDGEEFEAKEFSELKAGDTFELIAFVPPGVYSSTKIEPVIYDPNWNRVTIKGVSPLTSYENNESKYNDLESLELVIYSSDESRAIVLGNIPLSLLVFQEDYAIPAFGVGVLSASENIERRYLRMSEGPKPHYAYLTHHKEGKFYGVNNHEFGMEQVYLRPVERDGKVFLRITLVSYERITDLLELEVALDAGLATKIKEVSKTYRTPLFRGYIDNNIL